MKQLFFIFVFILGGCAIQQPDTNNYKMCRYVERDLTAIWAERSYWCLPSSRISNNSQRTSL